MNKLSLFLKGRPHRQTAVSTVLMSIVTVLLFADTVCSIRAQTVSSANDIAKANNAFTFDLYSKLSGQAGNLSFSPYSIETALTMTYAGAQGQTSNQMATVLRLPQVLDSVHAGFASLAKAIKDDGEASTGMQFLVANSLWGQKNLAYQSAFMKIVQKQYGASLNQVDFKTAAESARQQINDWVSRQTMDKITDLIPGGMLTPDTRLVLANAIYFKTRWDHEFEKSSTQNEPFYLNASKSNSVSMMHIEREFNYAETEILQMLELPYVSGRFSMIVLLPKKIDGLAELEPTINEARLGQWLKQSSPTEVEVSLPKYRLDTEFSLAKTLQQMGITDAFATNAVSPRRGFWSLYFSRDTSTSVGDFCFNHIQGAPIDSRFQLRQTVNLFGQQHNQGRRPET